MAHGERNTLGWLWLGIGVIAYAFVGWRWNIPVAAWVTPVFLMRFFRTRRRWYAGLAAVPLLGIASYLGKAGGWDVSVVAQIAMGLVTSVPMVLALYADRAVAGSTRPLLSSLVFPTVIVVEDFFLGLTPFGSLFSAATSQLGATAAVQMISVTGIWGLSFLIAWTASAANTWWQNGFDVRASRRPLAALGLSLAVVIGVGAARIAVFPPASPTVRVAGVTVEHARNYWEIVDIQTPRAEAHRYESEIRSMERALFAASARAADAGAKIVFWSEGNAMVYPEDEAAFIERARSFAREHSIHLIPAYLVFRYGSSTSDNRLTMITPNGEVAYTYLKTKSWYPSDSDGKLHTVDTPHGRISTAICFDMNFPRLIRQAGVQRADIVLVPAFDTERISPYHTEVGLLRAVENGFSVVRQVNEGTSMAMDYQGRILAVQDFFGTKDRLMICDVPTRGVDTPYAMLGDWFAYLTMVLAVFLIVWWIREVRLRHTS